MSTESDSNTEEKRARILARFAKALLHRSRWTKTVVVVATDRVRHRRYNKTVQRDKRLYVHDENNDANVGDRVRVAETRPLSKTKRWRLVEILERSR